ncbi:MAG: winged helix-turn-helix transcriptional regulator [Cytophagales bacterium]|nr:winged helix-turn-helix transcriptional regulator [Cytophagales bacterium]
MSGSTETNLVFSALADKSRRQIVELLHTKDSSIVELTQSFDMSFQAISKHVRILENAAILKKRKQGKFMICSLNHQALTDSLKWISYYSNFWNESFNKLEGLIKKQKND